MQNPTPFRFTSFFTLLVSLLFAACSGGGGGGGGGAGEGSLGALMRGGFLGGLNGSDVTPRDEFGSAGLDGLIAIAVDSKANRIYAYDGKRKLIVGSSFGGKTSLASQPKGDPSSIVSDPVTGDLFGFRYGNSTQDELFRIDPRTAEVTVIGLCARIVRATYDSGTGRLVAVTPDRKLALIDPSTGASSILYSDQDLAGFTGLAYDPATARLLATRGSESSQLYEISMIGPGVTPLHTFDQPLVDLSIDTDSGRLFGLTAGHELVELGGGPVTGTLSSLRDFGRDLVALTLDARDGRYFAVDAGKQELVKFDASTDTVTRIGRFDGVRVHTMVYDAVLGRIFGIDTLTRQLVEIEPATGEATIKTGWTFYPDTYLVIDPQSGTIFAYEGERDITLLVDPAVPSASLIQTTVLNTSTLTYFVRDLTWDPVLGRIVACGFRKTDEGGGSFSFDDYVFSFAPTQRGAGLLASTAAIAPVGIGYDPMLARYDLVVPGQPPFVLEPGAPGTDYFTQTGLWQRDYRSSVRAEGELYAIDSQYVFRIDTQTGATHLVSGMAGGVADDVVYDPNTKYLGFHRHAVVTWAALSTPFASKGAYPLKKSYDVIVSDPTEAGALYGIADGRLYRESTTSGAVVQITTTPTILTKATQAVLRGGYLVAVLEDRMVVRIDVTTGEWTSLGRPAFDPKTLFTF